MTPIIISAPTVRVGDVIEYTPDRNERHCREGVAVAVAVHDQSIRFMDTYWVHSHSRLTSPDYDSHFLTGTELATGEAQFNITDLRPANRGEDLTVLEPGDVFCVSGQHGLCKQYFVRPGATRSNRVILDRERQRVADAQAKLESARRSLEHSERELARLEHLDAQGEQL